MTSAEITTYIVALAEWRADPGPEPAPALPFEADLREADLREADLRGANLRGAILPAGYTWSAYLAEVVPALLAAGGRPVGYVLDEIRAAGGWATCHTWHNCPLHLAFGADGLDAIPALYRWEARQFVQFFDAGLISEPTTLEVS